MCASRLRPSRPASCPPLGDETRARWQPRGDDGIIPRVTWMRAALLAIATLLVATALAVGACQRVLPERFAVNAPVAHLLFGVGVEPVSGGALSERVALPDGFAIGIFADGLPNARFLRFTAAGDLLVSTTRSGRIVLVLRDGDGDGRSDGTRTLLEGLDRPQGMDFLDEWLYVGESGSIGRVRFDPVARAVDGDYVHVVTGIPAGGNHYTRTLRFGPDGWMYVTVGSSCNVCVESDDRRAAMLRFRPDGREAQIFATGLRNSAGFDWQPGTNALYATDNGRDLLGDDFPPCELNRVELGGFYGWPVANGDRVPDPNLGAGQEERIRKSTPPVHGFGAHTAPLGIVFLRNEAFPKEWRGSALVALHGSWNRTRKSGYKVVSLEWSDHGAITERDFIVGFEQDENVIGRPVDVAEGADGTIYVSDDYASSIYWVKYGAPAR